MPTEKPPLPDGEMDAGDAKPRAASATSASAPDSRSSPRPPPPPFWSAPWRPRWWSRRRISVAIGVIALLSVAGLILVVLGLLGLLRVDHTPKVNLGYATYVGTRVSNGDVDRYIGMRYAAAPLGDLRWRAPAAPPNSSSDQQATSYGPICYGISDPFNSTGVSEDCLFVNVWKPAKATSDSKLPVWLFIQGGGYINNANANWDATDLLVRSNQSIVFVSFNYRVALWGFLASERLRDDGALNAGLLDQRYLMQWVQRHIAAFGGDPGNVTIHGASAGAGSVALHMSAYGGRDDKLFVAAIAESVFFPAQPYVSELEYQFDRLVTALNCSSTSNTTELVCLRNQTGAALQGANVPSAFPGRTPPPALPLFYWSPCVDGEFITDLPYNLFANHTFVKGLSVLFGNDNDEGSNFAPRNADSLDDLAVFIQDNYPLLTSTDVDNIAATYPVDIAPAVPHHSTWYPSISVLYGEATFICPAINIFSEYAAADSSSAVWAYRYNVQDDVATAAGVGVVHLFEAWAVFGPTNCGGSTPPASYLTYNAPMVPIMMDYWLSFVIAKDPNVFKSVEAPVWEEVSTVTGGGNETMGSRLVLELNDNRMEGVPKAQVERCGFWEGLRGRTEQK